MLLLDIRTNIALTDQTTMNNMTTIITITNVRGRYTCTHTTDNKKTFQGDAGYDPESAAAYAVSIALFYDKYIIFGPKIVLDCIPEEFRRKP